MTWKELALTLYFRLNGRRCVICSHPVTAKDGHIEHDGELIFLMHRRCWKSWGNTDLQLTASKWNRTFGHKPGKPSI